MKFKKIIAEITALAVALTAALSMPIVIADTHDRVAGYEDVMLNDYDPEDYENLTEGLDESAENTDESAENIDGEEDSEPSEEDEELAKTEEVEPESEEIPQPDEPLTYEGFTFELLEDGTLAVIGYTGDSDIIIIPDELEEKPVTVIADGALLGSKWAYVPETVVYIGENLLGESLSQLVIFGHSASYAETYAMENGLQFFAIGGDTLVDDFREIEVVLQEFDSKADVTLNITDGYHSGVSDGIYFSIALVDGEGSEIQPESPVLVRIKVPYGWKDQGVGAYRVEEDGTENRLNSFIYDGCIVFITDSFSEFMIAVETGDGEDEPGIGDGEDEPGTGDGEDEPGIGGGEDEPGTGDGEDEPGTGDGEDEPGTGDGEDEPGIGDGEDGPGTGDGEDEPGTGDGEGEPDVDGDEGDIITEPEESTKPDITITEPEITTEPDETTVEPADTTTEPVTETEPETETEESVTEPEITTESETTTESVTTTESETVTEPEETTTESTTTPPQETTETLPQEEEPDETEEPEEPVEDEGASDFVEEEILAAPKIDVSVPSNISIIINPYGLDVNIAGVEYGTAGVSSPVYTVINKTTTSGIRVVADAFLRVPYIEYINEMGVLAHRYSIHVADTPAEVESANKKSLCAYVYSLGSPRQMSLAMVDNPPNLFDGFDVQFDEDTLVFADATLEDKVNTATIIELNKAEEDHFTYAQFKVSGNVTSNDLDEWKESDKVDFNLVLHISPIEEEAAPEEESTAPEEEEEIAPPEEEAAPPDKETLVSSDDDEEEEPETEE